MKKIYKYGWCGKKSAESYKGYCSEDCWKGRSL